MVWVIQPFYGIAYSIRAFVSVTAAGLGNLPGVMAAGLGIGAAEQFRKPHIRHRLSTGHSCHPFAFGSVRRLLQQRRNRQVLNNGRGHEQEFALYGGLIVLIIAAPFPLSRLQHPTGDALAG